MSCWFTCTSTFRDADCILDVPLNFTSNSAWSSLRRIIPVSFTRARRICLERTEVLLMHIRVNTRVDVLKNSGCLGRLLSLSRNWPTLLSCRCNCSGRGGGGEMSPRIPLTLPQTEHTNRCEKIWNVGTGGCQNCSRRGGDRVITVQCDCMIRSVFVDMHTP